jgi:hypothetical protein
VTFSDTVSFERGMFDQVVGALVPIALAENALLAIDQLLPSERGLSR